MLSGLPSFIAMPISFTLFCLNLAIVGTLLVIGGLIKILIPLKFAQKVIYDLMHFVYRTWALNNYLIMMLFNKIEWKIKGNQNLNKKSWYLLIA
ncbi:MAG: acyltransferase, partial [Colwelliaceae bacterium]|nr:acyltransferase [Colwelliaceae bacterium]